MKRLFLIAMMLIFATSTAYSQYYTTGVGLRAGSSSGITVKHNIAKDVKLEGIVGARWGGFNLTGLYEIHKPAFNVNRLNWYYGFGGHIGFWGDNDASWGDKGKDYAVVGVVGILGMEYNLKDIPFNVGLDWKPVFNIASYTGLWIDEFALSVRYTF